MEDSHICAAAAGLAELDAVFDPTDRWRCQCGQEHEFTEYAAAHWHIELEHTCACGARRTFLEGGVVA